MYVPSTRKIIYSYDVVYDEILYSALAYTSQPYSEVMVMHPDVTYIPCATFLRKQTVDIIRFAQFEEGNILTKTRNNSEKCDKSNDDSIMQPLLSEEEINAIDYGDESYHDHISTEILEDIHDRSQSHPNVNKREARYKIRDHIRQRKSE